MLLNCRNSGLKWNWFLLCKLNFQNLIQMCYYYYYCFSIANFLSFQKKCTNMQLTKQLRKLRCFLSTLRSQIELSKFTRQKVRTNSHRLSSGLFMYAGVLPSTHKHKMNTLTIIIIILSVGISKILKFQGYLCIS